MLIFLCQRLTTAYLKTCCIVSVLIKFVSESYTPEIEILLLLLYRYITNTLLFLYSDSSTIMSCEDVRHWPADIYVYVLADVLMYLILIPLFVAMAAYSYTIDILFRQITTFIKVRVAFVLGLQTL